MRKLLALSLGIVTALISITATAGTWEQISFTGGLRTAYIYNPVTTSPIGDGKALFVVLRGCIQPASNYKTANLDKVADEYGMVIVAADPNNSAGADCWGYWSGMRSRSSGDYKAVIATTEAIIADAKYDIDPNQIYIGGLSSGGAFAMTVGCLAPDIYAGMALDAAPSAGTGMGGAFSHEGTPESVKRSCESFAGNYKSYFATQITTTAYGTSDGIVPKTYGLQNAQAMALIYGVNQTDEQNKVHGRNDVTESTWEDGRVSMVVLDNVGHAWPGGSGASGSYIDGSSSNYGQYMAEFFTANNMRVPNIQPGNIAPVLSNISAITSGNTIIVTGTASDSDGTIASVMISVNDDYHAVAIDGTNAIAINEQITDLPNGNYTIIVSATDDDKLSTNSLPITVTIPAAEDYAPEITSFEVTQNDNCIIINASATDRDGFIEGISYQVDNGLEWTMVNQQDTSSFTMPTKEICEIQTGEHTITITAFDNSLNETTQTKDLLVGEEQEGCEEQNGSSCNDNIETSNQEGDSSGGGAPNLLILAFGILIICSKLRLK